MKVEIKIPAMGESISEATIGTILKVSGSTVAADEEILELETDKVNQVLYAPVNGVLTLNVKSDQTVKIGDVIGFVEEGAAKAPEKSAPEKPIQAQEKPLAQPAQTPVKSAEPKLPEPKEAREQVRIGKEQRISELTAGTGAPSQKTIKPQESASDKPVERKKLSKIRKVIAARMVEAKQQTAMLTTFNEVDMSAVMGLREKYKELFQKTHEAKLGFMSFFVKAVVAALQEVPEVNSYIDGDDLVLRRYYDIGIAVGTDKGVFVPVVKDCDTLSLAAIESLIEQFSKKAREGTLTADDLQGGVFTITNGGVFGSLLSTPILNPPQSAILGMHKIEKRPVVVGDQIVIRPMMYVALSYDHRVIDGKEAVTFLVKVKERLEDPARLLLEV